jgi:hypothetical protein
MKKNPKHFHLCMVGSRIEGAQGLVERIFASIGEKTVG